MALVTICSRTWASEVLPAVADQGAPALCRPSSMPWQTAIPLVLIVCWTGMDIPTSMAPSVRMQQLSLLWGAAVHWLASEMPYPTRDLCIKTTPKVSRKVLPGRNMHRRWLTYSSNRCKGPPTWSMGPLHKWAKDHLSVSKSVCGALNTEIIFYPSY